MANKPWLPLTDQIAQLKSRGMLFRDETQALHFLSTISYYRLKGYWWDMQSDVKHHSFKPDTFFEDIIDRYNFDRHLRLILFDAVERIEIALRTQMIYQLARSYGGLWYLNTEIVEELSKHEQSLVQLQNEFQRSQEIFVKDQKSRFPDQHPDAWIILEVASLGTLSKIYKNLKHQLPEKALIAKGMGLQIHSELSSWLEAITYIRNIIAHHSRLWSRNMVKKPIFLKNPTADWFQRSLTDQQTKKPFSIISCMLYLCNAVTPNHQIKSKILALIDSNPNIPIYKLGFVNNWRDEPLWNDNKP